MSREILNYLKLLKPVDSVRIEKIFNGSFPLYQETLIKAGYNNFLKHWKTRITTAQRPNYLV